MAVLLKTVANSFSASWPLLLCILCFLDLHFTCVAVIIKSACDGIILKRISLKHSMLYSIEIPCIQTLDSTHSFSFHV